MLVIPTKMLDRFVWVCNRTVENYKGQQDETSSSLFEYFLTEK